MGRIPWNKGVTGYSTSKKGFKHSEKFREKCKKKMLNRWKDKLKRLGGD